MKSRLPKSYVTGKIPCEKTSVHRISRNSLWMFTFKFYVCEYKTWQDWMYIKYMLYTWGCYLREWLVTKMLRKFYESLVFHTPHCCRRQPYMTISYTMFHTCFFDSIAWYDVICRKKCAYKTSLNMHETYLMKHSTITWLCQVWFNLMDLRELSNNTSYKDVLVKP